jgi:glycosyltransferase involved in cell wall biosynthesis
MKVLHVIPSLSAVHGGPSRALPLMERSLAAEGVTVETATTNDNGPGRHNGRTCGLPLFENGVTRHYFHKQVDFYKVSLDLAGWLKCHAPDYDLLHIHALFSFSSIAAAWAARRAGVPYIVRPLGTLTHYGRTQRRPWLKRQSLKWIEGPVLRDAAAVHFTSLDEQREAEACGVPMRSVVIPLGIEAPAVTDDTLVRSRFVALQAAPYLLYLSRLDPKKNLEGLLRAFAQCRGLWPNTQLLIAGTGTRDYVANLVTLASALGLDNHVVWAGHMDGELKASALAGAQLFVLPSFSENFGIAAAEALMAGLPCLLGQGVAIATDVVQAGAGVAVVPEPNAIAAGLRQLLAADASEYARMSANAAALASDKFSVEAMGRNLVALYESVLASKPPR